MKITNIDINDEQLNIQLSQQSGHVMRKEFIRKHRCNSCYQWATKLVTYQMGDKDQPVTKLERYCQKHYELIIIAKK